ncbi:MAG: hypothetical protein JZU70_01540, partial [Chlorobium sp.]|nr:hypothetical protein [Chlorobium sp.]
VKHRSYGSCSGSVDGTTITADWGSVFTKLDELIEAGETITVTSPTDLALTLTGEVDNVAFTVEVTVSQATSELYSSAVSEIATITPAGTTVAQISEVAFNTALNTASGSLYTVVVNGAEYSAQAGDNHFISITNTGSAAITFDALGLQDDSSLGTIPAVTDASTSSARTIDFSGILSTVGLDYTVSIDSKNFTFKATDTNINTVAFNLASLIQNDTSTDYVASASRSTITITSGAGLLTIEGVMNTTGAKISEAHRTVSLSGMTAKKDSVYTVTIDPDDTGALPAIPISVTAASFDTISDVATALATEINKISPYKATASNGVITITDGAGSATITVSAKSWLPVSGLNRVTIANTTEVPAACVINLSNLTAFSGGKYSVKIGTNSPITYTADANATLTEITNRLAALITNATAINRTGASVVANSWAGILGALKTDIEAGEAVSVAVDNSSIDATHANHKLTLTANTTNVPFTIDGAFITPLSTTIANMGDIPVVVADGTHAQQSVVQFAEATPSTSNVYSVVIDGKAYSLQVGNNDFLTVTGANTANIGLMVFDTTANANAFRASAPALLSTNGKRMVSFTGVSVVSGATYVLVVGNEYFSYDADAGDTIQKVVTGLKVAITANTTTVVDATASSVTVNAADWPSLLNAFKTLIEADGKLTVDTSSTDKTLTLTSKTNNTAFTVNAVAVTPKTTCVVDPVLPITPAGVLAAQISKITFAEATTANGGGGYTLENGLVYTVQIDFDTATSTTYNTYTVTTGTGTGEVNLTNISTIEGKWNAILTALGNKIKAVEPVTVTFDAANRTLTLTATDDNTPFAINAVTVGTNGTRLVTGAFATNDGVEQNGSTPTQAVAASAKQVTTLDFAGVVAKIAPNINDEKGHNYLYTVSVDSENYKKSYLHTYSSIGTDIVAVVNALVISINDDSTRIVDALNVGNTLQLTALADNTSFIVTATAEDNSVGTPSNPIPFTGNYVLVLTGRNPGDIGLKATENLTVVRLDTYTSELINLSAGKALVVVDALNVGTDDSTGGKVQLTAGEGLTLGGKITAKTLEIAAKDNVTVTSEVKNLSIAMSGAGDVTISQTDTTVPLHISTLDMKGGNIRIVVDDDIIIDEITGTAGDVTIISKTGDITLTSMTSAKNVVLSAVAGSITAGALTTTIEADTLDVTTKGAISIYEKDAVDISKLFSSDGEAVTVIAGGSVTLAGAISTSGAGRNVLLQTTAGSITVTQSLTTASGNITIAAAAGISLTERAALTSTGGNIILNAGSGAMTMAEETVVNAGSGTIDLDAGGAITLGKLRTTNSANLTINSGGVIDGSEGSTDIIAKNAKLVIVASGGIGSYHNPIETEVAGLDLENNVTGDIAIEDVDGLVVYNVDQNAAGNVSLSTQNGSILIAGQGVNATSGMVTIYAGNSGTLKSSPLISGIVSAFVNNIDPVDKDAARAIKFYGTTPLVDAAYKITIGSKVFSYTAKANDTFIIVADELATLIDADTTFAANATDTIITITAGAGQSTITFACESTVAVERTIDFSTLVARAGVLYKLTLDSKVFTYTANATDTAESIVNALAVLINNDAVFEASSTAKVLSITYGAGKSSITFNTVVGAIDLAADINVSSVGSATYSEASVSDIDADRTINLSAITAQVGAVYKVAIDSKLFSYTATLTDTITTIVGELVTLINKDSAFTASGTGSEITLTKGAGMALLHFSRSAVLLIAEGADITLGAGVHVIGAGDIIVKAPEGGIVNSHTPVVEGEITRVAGWLTVADGSDANTERDFNPAIEELVQKGWLAVTEETGKMVASGIPSYREDSLVANSTVLRAANGAFLQTTAGDMTIAVRDEIGELVDGFMFSPLAIVIDAENLTVSSSERKDVVIFATGSVTVKKDTTSSGSQGGATTINSFGGEQVIADSLDASGNDINIRADDVTIKNAIRSSDAILSFVPFNPTAPIFIGTAHSTVGMSIDKTELSYLQDGFKEIVIGSEEGSHVITIGSTDDDKPVEFQDTLHI